MPPNIPQNHQPKPGSAPQTPNQPTNTPPAMGSGYITPQTARNMNSVGRKNTNQQLTPRPTGPQGDWSGKTNRRSSPRPQTKAKKNPNSAQNSMLFSEIRDGLVVMNDGSFRAAVMVKSINFDLMSAAEQDAVEYSYKGFLNSLDFNTQILIQSRKIDMGPYMHNLERIRDQQENMLLAILTDDYIDFINELVTDINIMDKRFFVIIPYYSEVDKKTGGNKKPGLLGNIFGSSKSKLVINETTLNIAKDELKNRIQLIMDGLNNIGLRSAPLGTKELIELFYNSYNIGTSHNQPIKNIGDVTAPIITKGKGRVSTVNNSAERSL